MKITNEIMAEINKRWYRIKILPEIKQQAERIGVKIFEPTDARVMRIRHATQDDWDFLIPFWWGKYEVTIEEFEHVIEVAYEGHKRIYHYPSNTVEMY